MSESLAKFNPDTVEAWLCDPVTKAYLAWIQEDVRELSDVSNIPLNQSCEEVAMTTVAIANRVAAARDYTDRSSIFSVLTVFEERDDE